MTNQTTSIVLNGNEYAVDKTGCVELEIGKIPNLLVAEIPTGVWFVVFTFDFVIGLWPDRVENTAVFLLKGKKMDFATEAGRRLQRILEYGIKSAQKKNPSVREVTKTSLENGWKPGITAHVSAMSLPDLLLSTMKLATKALFTVACCGESYHSKKTPVTECQQWQWSNN
jgi:hypothetical protein